MHRSKSDRKTGPAKTGPAGLLATAMEHNLMCTKNAKEQIFYNKIMTSVTHQISLWFLSVVIPLLMTFDYSGALRTGSGCFARAA